MTSESGLKATPEVVVIGAGRVGLPIALLFAARDVVTAVVDVDPVRCRQINAGVAPFVEPGLAELLAPRALHATSDFGMIGGARVVLISVGTPLLPNLEPDIAQLRACITAVAVHAQQGQLIVLRSTLPPGTTSLVRDWIEDETTFTVGTDIFLAYCPERLAEGVAIRELQELPQIVGADDHQSLEKAASLFSSIAPKVVPTSTRHAELAKLFANASRYAEFAIANHLALLAEELGADYHEVRSIATEGYPRGIGRRPGFTAGTCLRKDFGMLSEFSFGPDILTAAWRVNESVPARLIAGVKERREIRGARVSILGMTFKADVDDMRDSLSVKLYRQILREHPRDIRVSDPFLGDSVVLEGVGPVENHAFTNVVDGADIVFIATNHSEYYDRFRRHTGPLAETLFVDLWNVTGARSVYYWGGANV